MSTIVEVNAQAPCDSHSGGAMSNECRSQNSDSNDDARTKANGIVGFGGEHLFK